MLVQAIVSSEVYLLLSSYALSTEREETLAMLLGRFAPTSNGSDRVMGIVEKCLFCQRKDKRKDRVEISSEQLSEAISYAERTGTSVVGWAHSHPHITVFPSAVDLRCQNDQQMLDSNFFGLIYSCFNDHDKAQRNQLTCFQAFPDSSNVLQRTEIPVLVQPSRSLSHDGLHQLSRIPEIFMSEELDFFKKATDDQAMATQAESKVILSYHSGQYIRTITLLLDKLCGPLSQFIAEKQKRNQEEILRLQYLLEND